MNLTGVRNYNQEVGAIRQPTNNSDTLKRLLFIYPFGIDQSIANVPFQTFAKGDMDTIGDSLRTFFSISVLKEIFTSNALNLVTLASNYQRMERRKTKSNVLINSLLRGGTSDGYYYRTYDDYNRYEDEVPQLDASVIQSKLNEKFKRIKDYLRSDPRLKKFLPFMEVITLNNMLDVPVIVGTAAFQLDSEALFALLAAAIAQRRKLSTWAEIHDLTTKLKSMPDQSVYDIFQVLSNVSGNSSIPNQVQGSSLILPYQTNLQYLETKLNQEEDPKKKEKLKIAVEQERRKYAFDNISNLKETKMQELERNLLLMTKPEQLLIRYGLSGEAGQTKFITSKVSAQTDLLFSRTKQEMVDFFSGSDVLFSSIYNLLSPAVLTDSSYSVTQNGQTPRNEYTHWNYTYLDLKNEFVDDFSDNFDSFMTDLKSFFDKTIEGELKDVSDKVSKMNSICDGAREDFVALMNFFHSTLSKPIYPTFSEQDIIDFFDNLDKVATKFSVVKKTTLESLRNFLGSQTVRQIESGMDIPFSNSFDKFFTPFNSTADPLSPLQAKIYALPTPEGDNVGDLNMFLARQMDKHRKVLLQSVESVKVIAQAAFLLIFKINLCEFVQVADVEFSTAKADVLDLPNYCLVLPLEVLHALMVLYTKRNLTQAVLTSGTHFNPLNVSYTKGLVKTLRYQLGIPNLLVYDKKRNELFYSFQYLGNTAEKVKMAAVETFVKHHLQDNASGMSQVYY